ncbi:MAG: hypothetical protein PVJ26_16785, partial [Anaerolineae bacterium]
MTPTPTKTRVALALATNTLEPTATRQPSATLTSSPGIAPTVAATRPTSLARTDTPTAAAVQTVPSDTPLPPTPTPTGVPAATAPAPSPRLPTVTPTTSSQPALPPQQGGEWDMEAGFVPGVSPLGEDCPGWAVAVGWQAFVAPGTPASSCLNENKNAANVRSGERSQELTFDFVSAEAGILKRAQTISGHRYRIEAWGKHIRSASPVELSLGVDLAGGEDWQAASVMWYPWDGTEEEAWVHTQVTVRAGGE